LHQLFLQRAACLVQEHYRRRLRVERGKFAMLMDRLPWSFSTIRLRWMKSVLEVNW